ncbi:IclR family transcriptional regulator [Labrys monachus]|uniref:DNA-binding IclR family transcriptional regulator n=1 Tax=Labrys monachus TaxID=217067 RepID=A0ABU0FCZ0_9HYPH|nr:IclR family transcriptional regulator [Labrys monachus]MDQ0391935.1 DNA-binding IclR family transcriptional regulator [Labrys monachus]
MPPGRSAAKAIGVRVGQVRERSIDRAIRLFECLHAARQPLAVAEIARRLKAPRSTIYDIVNRFTAAGILEVSDLDGRIYFGTTLYFYAADYLGANALLRRARDEVDRLAALTGETTEFGVLQGDKYAAVHRRPGTRLPGRDPEAGIRLPIPWTAAGRLLLASMTPDAIRDLIPPQDFVLPDGRRIDVDDFLADVARAAADGYCITSGLADNTAACLAVPIRDRRGAAVATLCFIVKADAAPVARMGLVEVLKNSARSLSAGPAQETSGRKP